MRLNTEEFGKIKATAQVCELCKKRPATHAREMYCKRSGKTHVRVEICSNCHLTTEISASPGFAWRDAGVASGIYAAEQYAKAEFVNWLCNQIDDRDFADSLEFCVRTFRRRKLPKSLRRIVDAYRGERAIVNLIDCKPAASVRSPDPECHWVFGPKAGKWVAAICGSIVATGLLVLIVKNLCGM